MAVSLEFQRCKLWGTILFKPRKCRQRVASVDGQYCPVSTPLSFEGRWFEIPALASGKPTRNAFSTLLRMVSRSSVTAFRARFLFRQFCISEYGLTFLRGHRKERSSLLVDVCPTTFRTFDFVFLVFGKAQD